MNYNLGTLKCCECNTVFSCRVGQSNQDIAKYHLICKNCEADSYITLKSPSRKNIKFSFDGVEQYSGDESASYHVDLHLDFPVTYEKEHPMFSPFIRAIFRFGHSRLLQHERNIKSLQEISKAIKDYDLLLRYYKNGKMENFAKKFKDIFGTDIQDSVHNPYKMERHLFQLLLFLSLPFDDIKNSKILIDEFYKIIENKDQSFRINLRSLVSKLSDEGILDQCVKDSINIYRELIEKETIFRPSLLASYDVGFTGQCLPFKVSYQNYEYIKELYKNICELVSRQLILIAGINNIIHRNDFNKFKATINRKGKATQPKNLDEYHNIVLAKKLDLIDDSWLSINPETINNKLRNSIAHYSYEYEDFRQHMTYNSGNKKISISLFEFCFRCVDIFRLMHVLNCIIHDSRSLGVVYLRPFSV